MSLAVDHPSPTFPDTFNLADYFLDQRIREGRGERIAVIDDRGEYSYARVQALSEHLAGALWQAGIRPEDRCLIGLWDCVEFAASFFGIVKAGAVVAMVNPELADGDYLGYLSYTRCRALIVDGALYRRLAPILREAGDAICCLRLIVVVDTLPHPEGAEPAESPPAGVTRLTWDEVQSGPRRPTYATSKDDPAVWLFTSGSTGKPKAAVHFHHDFAYNTECYAKQILRIGEDDVTLAVPKLYFGYATGTNLLFPFAVGGKTVLYRDRWSPERLFDLVARHRATVLTGVPTAMSRMLEADPERRRSLRPLRVVLSAGEALPEELYRRFLSAYGVEILDGIGSAELFHIYISNRLGEVRPGSLGRLVPGYHARIVRDDGSDWGRDAEVGEIGTLWVRGDSAALCYWQAHESSKKTLRGDWVVSGDLFHCDAEGFFYYDGRADDLLKLGGIFVSPLEVEGVLLQHEAILEVAVVGEENAEGLVKGLAFVVVQGGQQADEALARAILAFGKSRLAHYKVPQRIEFVAALPRSDRGKVLRRVLQKQTGGGPAT
jgi:benzoate-CoA ligase family protein